MGNECQNLTATVIDRRSNLHRTASKWQKWMKHKKKQASYNIMAVVHLISGSALSGKQYIVMEIGNLTHDIKAGEKNTTA